MSRVRLDAKRTSEVPHLRLGPASVFTQNILGTYGVEFFRDVRVNDFSAAGGPGRGLRIVDRGGEPADGGAGEAATRGEGGGGWDGSEPRRSPRQLATE